MKEKQVTPKLIDFWKRLGRSEEWIRLKTIELDGETDNTPTIPNIEPEEKEDSLVKMDFKLSKNLETDFLIWFEKAGYNGRQKSKAIRFIFEDFLKRNLPLYNIQPNSNGMWINEPTEDQIKLEKSEYY
jgi:hypothetical protein